MGVCNVCVMCVCNMCVMRVCNVCVMCVCNVCVIKSSPDTYVSVEGLGGVAACGRCHYFCIKL